MSRFQVHDNFILADKGTYILAGFALEGEVRAGMFVSIPFNATVKMKAEIDRIEIVRRPDGDVVCLCINCAAPDEATLWEALKLRNRTIDLALA